MLAFPQKTIENDFSNAATPDYSDFEMIDEIWDGEHFNAVNFNKLVDYVFPQNAFPNGTDNFYFNALAFGIEFFPWNLYNWGGVQNVFSVQRKNAVVKFAGYNWLPVLAVGQCYENAYEDRGSNHQIHQIILTLLYFDDVSDLSTQMLPGLTKDDYDYFYDLAYGSSYINAVTLNNGGQYLNKDGTYTTATKDSHHKFAAYTTDENLTQYLLTPNQHIFQAESSIAFMAGGFQYYLNPNMNEAVYNSSYDDSQYYNAWGNSTLWLPSTDETTSINNSRLQGGAFGLKDISLETSWTRNLGGFYDGIDSRYSTDYFGTAIARPALHLNLTKAAQNLKWPNLADNVSSDKDDPDIYKVETSSGIDFHIKSADGFLKLSSTEWAFDPSWKFYLDKDINLSASCDKFTPVGSATNPFVGTFDGQGHIVTYSQKNFESGATVTASLFGSVGTCNIQNLDVRCDISTTGTNSATASGLIANCTGGTCHISHITISGNAGTASLIKSAQSTDIYIYDVTDLTTASCLINSLTESQGSFRTLEINSSTTQTSFAVVLSLENYNATFNGFMGLGCLLLISSINGECSIKCTECQLISENVFALITGSGDFTVALYDTVIINTNTNPLLPVMPPGMKSAKYLGVYLASSTEVSILDPNFTSYKWCMDPHLNDGLPQLRRFVSIGDFMEQCNMNDWIASLK